MVETIGARDLELWKIIMCVYSVVLEYLENRAGTRSMPKPCDIVKESVIACTCLFGS